MHLEDLDLAQSAVRALLADLSPDDWPRPTPCEDWDVAAVVRHLCVGERAFTTSLGGVRYDLAAIRAELGVLAAADLPTAYGVGAAALRDALMGADDEATYPTGIGPMSATAIAELRTIEALVHGWDVARGTGRTLGADGPVAERAISASLALIERLPADRSPFGPPRPVADDAPAIERLAALLGRDVSG